ncbi:MAG TPA: BrnT family toxin [Gemmatimonadaceae bacterium]|nr:BrnT family toxin [Gemmatimonadaceae bacterium]
MADLHFERDPAKARANIQKHGISFDEAETAFSDEHALVMPDPEHSSTHEERLVLLGLSAALRVLVVIHCELEAGGVIRLISARRATRSERAQYDARWKR